MNLFELFVKIGADTSEVDKSFGDVGQKTSNLGEKLKAGLAAVGKAAVAGVAAGAAALGTLGTKAVSAYADYEQLVGGVETLFKDSQDKVLEYANGAYEAAGLSANEYMETVTSFSASLLQSLGGDTDAAAEKANLAIVDMSDNANKMGTSMESIQNAYQGFAKQNYTMLDNLKLGYGGTKEEMGRLLADAEKLSGQKFDLSSYADIVDAIHIVQKEMGITGTTADEAATTIQGSIGMMKSAWENLVTGMADPDQDLGALVENFANSVVTVGDNLIPRIQELLPRVVEAVTALIDSVGAQLPGILETVLPPLLAGATTLVAGLLEALPSVLSVIADVAPMIIETLIPAIINLLPQIVQTGIDIIVSLAQGIADSLPQLIPAATEAIIEIAEALTSPDNILSITETALEIILALTEGLVDAIPRLLEAAPKLISNLITSLIVLLPQIIESGVKIVMSLADGLIKSIPQLVAAGPKLIIGIVQGILDNLPQIILSGPKIILALIEGLINAIPDLILAIPEIISSIVDTFLSFDWGSVGKNIVDGIKNGFLNMWESLKATVNNLVDGLVGGVKRILGIASPSKVFAGIGGYMAEGLGQGFSSEMTDVRKSIEGEMTFGTASFATSGVARSSLGIVDGLLANNQSGVLSQVNLILDGRELAQVLFDPLRREVVQRGVSLA